MGLRNLCAAPAGGHGLLGGGRQQLEGGLGARQAALVGVHARSAPPERPPHVLRSSALRQPQHLHVILRSELIVVRLRRSKLEPEWDSSHDFSEAMCSPSCAAHGDAVVPAGIVLIVQELHTLRADIGMVSYRTGVRCSQSPAGRSGN